MSAEPILVRSPIVEDIIEVEREEECFEAILDVESTGLQPDLYRLVAVGVLILPMGREGARPQVKAFFVDEPTDECERAVIEGAVPVLHDAATVYTWRGEQFDMPFLLARALRHGIHMPWLPEKHVDLSEVVRAFLVSSHPQAKVPTLDRMCEFLFGYKRKLRLRGFDIPELYEAWQEGDGEAREQILEHLREDLEMTRMVLEAIRPYIDAYLGMAR